VSSSSEYREPFGRHDKFVTAVVRVRRLCYINVIMVLTAVPIRRSQSVGRFAFVRPDMANSSNDFVASRFAAGPLPEPATGRVTPRNDNCTDGFGGEASETAPHVKLSS